MDRPAKQAELLERIGSSASRVVVLVGPAACGKTSAVLAMAEDRRGEDGRGQCLLLAPNAPTVGQLTRRILDGSPGSVVLSPKVMTFAALARRLLAEGPPADAPGRGRMLSPLARRLALRGIIEELLAAGQLAAFAGVADTPGLTRAIDAAIAELKRAAIEPEALAGVARAGSAAALLAVYRRYQQHLHEANSYDLEGQMWLARDALASAVAAGELPATLADITAIAVDGFTDFTPTQLEMLRLAAAGVDRLVITLPLGADRRARLWQWTKRTLESIGRTFQDDVDVIAIDSPVASGLGALWEGVFDYDASAVARPGEPARPCSPSAGRRVRCTGEVQVIAAAGIEQEVVAVARRVKALLAAGARAGRIAVLTRATEEYRPAIERLFAERGIPAAPAPQPVTDAPVVRFALAAAGLGPRFDASDVLAVIGNSYFRPQALGDFDERTVAVAQALIRQGGVLTGRKGYASAAERFIRRAASAPAQEDQSEADDDAPIAPAELLRDGQAIGRAADMLEALFDAAGDDLADVIAALQLHQAACDQDDPMRIARDLRALAAAEAALADLPGAPSAGGLKEALSAVTYPPARSESLVDVLDVLDARALRYDHMFLVGLAEGQFPRRFTEGPLIGERQRRQWADKGVLLDARDALAAREMLLFYLAASRADKSLTLSFLDSDAGGRPAAPGAFLKALLAPVGGLAEAVTERIGLGQIICQPEQLCSPGEAMSAAMAGLFARDCEPAPGAVKWAMAAAGGAMGLAVRGLIADASRWRAGQAGPSAYLRHAGRFDGRITDPVLLAALAERYPKRVVFSASRLECFARCPWMYFARYVLGLEEPPPPTPHLEAARRGALCHEALYLLMTRLAETHGRPVRLGRIDADELAAAADDALAEAARRDEARLPSAYPILRQVQFDQLGEQLRRYVLAQRDGAGRTDTECLHFELAFGLGDLPEELVDPASRAEPITLETPGGPIRLRGKIDRVDAVAAAGQAGLLVVDYKTGALPRPKDIGAGLRVQIPLYAAAAGELLGRAAIGGAYHRIGGKGESVLLAAYKMYRGEPQPDEGYAEQTAGALQQIGKCVAAMAEGRFDMPTDVECPSWCALSRICQHSAARSAVRALGGAGDE